MMYPIINYVANLYGLKAISIHSCCTFNMSRGVMCVLQSWVLPRYCINAPTIRRLLRVEAGLSLANSLQPMPIRMLLRGI